MPIAIKKMEASVKEKFKSYPKNISLQLNAIRKEILALAETHQIEDLQETLKWGEPAYISKQGSTIRMDWKPKQPDQYCVYFNCQTTLIETFKMLYGDLFTYEGNRAIVFKKNQTIPLHELSHCMSLSLRYHQLKHLPFLGN